jgi:hypothetical protein
MFEQVPLRVASLRPDGNVVVDRGRRDLLQPGDKVVLTPRNGQVVQGTVTEVDDRTALVEIVDRNAAPPIGTKGHFLLPKARRAQPTVDVPLPPKVEAPPPVQPGEEEWQPGMPLLGSTRPPRPEERASRIDGRVYGAADVVRTQDTWSHSFGRAGVDLDASNLRGAGGVLHVHTEFVLATETTENTGADLSVYELSYELGGTRYQPVRWQIGRLLPRDMPEFGLLDGVEVGLRREGGDRLGLSVGWLPLLDEDMESFADLQVAAWYVWNADQAERMSVALGFQRSWHRYDSDRDLVILRTRYLPVDGWNVSSSVWVDLYSGEDVQKQDSFGLTRANAFASRRWEKAGGIDLAYDHEEYPETIRRELPQTIQPATLVDAHQDRVSLHAYWYSDAGTRWFTRGTGWIDEQREGGTAEVGAQFDDMFGKGSRSGLAGFVVQGSESSQIGVRLDHGGPFAAGRLDLLYELGFVHHESFPANRDDLVQHRLALLFSGDLGGGWDGLIHADATLWDDELSLALGIYLQRHF